MVNIKDCPRVLEDAKALDDSSPELVAWIGRLGGELSTGFCEGLSCIDCKVGQARRGMGNALDTPRQILVFTLTNALQARIDIVSKAALARSCLEPQDA